MADNNEETTSTSNSQKPTKWDIWMTIFQGLAAFGTMIAIPVSVYVAITSNDAQQAASASQALDQQHQTTLNNYLNETSNYVTNYNLANKTVNALVTAQTDTAIRSLDGARKGILVRYLWEVGLIKEPDPVIMLFETDLDGAVFINANLWLADIGQNSLVGSNFAGTRLYGTDLAHDNLSDAILTGANLDGADLVGADLAGARIEGAEYNSKPMEMTIAGRSITLRPTQWPKGFNFTSMGAVCVDC